MPSILKTKLNRELIKKVLGEGRNALTEAEAKELLSNYEIPVVRNAVRKQC